MFNSWAAATDKSNKNNAVTSLVTDLSEELTRGDSDFIFSSFAANDPVLAGPTKASVDVWARPPRSRIEKSQDNGAFESLQEDRLAVLIDSNLLRCAVWAVHQP